MAITILRKSGPRTTGMKRDQGALIQYCATNRDWANWVFKCQGNFLYRVALSLIVIQLRQQKIWQPAARVFQISSRRVTWRARSCRIFQLLLVGDSAKRARSTFLEYKCVQCKRNRIMDYSEFNCLYIYTDRETLSTNIIFYTYGCCLFPLGKVLFTSKEIQEKFSRSSFALVVVGVSQ